MRVSPEASLLTLLAAAPCSCFAPFEVECGADAHCNRFPGGLCHTNPETDRRWCSYPDPACSTGYRYSELDVGDGVSGTCTSEPPARCDPTAEFEPPAPLRIFNSSFDDSMSMSRDELSVLVYRYDGYSHTLQISRRASIFDEFPPSSMDPSLASILSATGSEHSLSFTADGLVVYFQRQLPGASPAIFVASRAAAQDVFGEGSRLIVGQTSSTAALQPGVSADGQTLYWLDYFDFRLRSATRAAFNRFQNEMIVSTSDQIWNQVISEDELTLYYTDGFSADILVAGRADRAVPFGVGVPVLNINSAQEDAPLFLTADGCQLYLTSKRAGGIGGYDIWVARRLR